MTSNLPRIQPGTNVYDRDGDKVGDVSETGSNYVLVRQGWLFTNDIYIPLSAIEGVDDDSIRLNVTKDQVATMGWDAMPADEATTTTYGTTSASVTDVDYTTTSTIRDATAQTDYAAAQTRTRDVESTEEVAIPVVEEELRVGKREVESGGVRVSTHVEEIPVNEQVTLRDEEVHLERRPVDRPASEADMAAVWNGTFEVREHDEQAVVSKEARIVEEVVIEKEVAQRIETVQDTVRRTEVDVQEIPGQQRTTGYSGTTGTATSTSGSTMSSATDEGAIERGASGLGNVVERGTGVDLDRDGDVGRRDPRNNI